MPKIRFVILIAINSFFYISCISTAPKVHTPMSYSDFVKLNDRNRALGDFVIASGDDYKLISDLYIINIKDISSNSFNITLRDAKTGDEFNAMFQEDITGRFKPEIIYEVYYHVPYNKRYEKYELNKIQIDRIEGLLTTEEYRAIITAEENERRQREEIAKQEQLALVEEEFRNAIASRDPVTIMGYLRSGNLTSLSSTDRSAIIQKGQLEVARILTGDNNVRINGFLTAWERYWGHSGRTTPLNTGAFEEGVVYTGTIIPDQVIDGIIYTQLSDTPESSVLYRNVSVQDIRSAIQDVLMVYIGQIPVRLTNGRTIRLPLFDVLYYRK